MFGWRAGMLYCRSREFSMTTRPDKAEVECFLAASEAEVEKGFEGPFEDLTPELMREIRNEAAGDFEIGSLAVPPGWRPKAR